MNANVPFVITDSSINLMLDGKMETVDSSCPQFENLKEALKGQHDIEELRQLVSIPKYISSQIFGQVTVSDDTVYYKGIPVHSHLTERLLNMMFEGFDIDPWARFMDNLMKNPNPDSRDQLYIFLEKSNLPITPDGHFLAFKKVNDDYTDCRTKTFDNSVGTTPSMPREDCDPSRNNTCSRGLHFCSQSYLGSYSAGARTMIVKVNPADVVAVPNDHNDAKARACRYEVVGELGTKVAENAEEKVTVRSVEDKSVNFDFQSVKRELENELTFSAPNYHHELSVKDVLNVAETEDTLTDAARDCGVARSTFTRWLKQAQDWNSIKNEEVYFGPYKLTAHQVLDLVNTYGSQAAAAESYGVAKSTFKGWVKKARSLV